MSVPRQRPPLITLLTEVLGWTMDRTATIPKSQRFTFGQKLDQLTLEALLHVNRAAFAGEKAVKARELAETGLLLEQINLLWELTQQRGWISQQQMAHIGTRLAEAGRMTGGWLRQVEGRKP